MKPSVWVLYHSYLPLRQRHNSGCKDVATSDQALDGYTGLVVCV